LLLFLPFSDPLSLLLPFSGEDAEGHSQEREADHCRRASMIEMPNFNPTVTDQAQSTANRKPSTNLTKLAANAAKQFANFQLVDANSPMALANLPLPSRPCRLLLGNRGLASGNFQLVDHNPALATANVEKHLYNVDQSVGNGKERVGCWFFTGILL
jgi:hypothetical protein